MTKREFLRMCDYFRQYLKIFDNPKHYSVQGFYRKPSAAKMRIENAIRRDMGNGVGFRVLCGNSNFFTVGFQTLRKGGGATFTVITPYHEYNADVYDLMLNYRADE